MADEPCTSRLSWRVNKSHYRLNYQSRQLSHQSLTLSRHFTSHKSEKVIKGCEQWAMSMIPTISIPTFLLLNRKGSLCVRIMWVLCVWGEEPLQAALRYISPGQIYWVRSLYQYTLTSGGDGPTYFCWPKRFFLYTPKQHFSGLFFLILIWPI